jgi:formylglycine-generating enzyme required for sulfatase activity
MLRARRRRMLGGLYDTLGNLWELCSDFIREPDSTPAVDFVGARSESVGAMRGDGWMEPFESCRAARRSMSNDMFGGAGIRFFVSV